VKIAKALTRGGIPGILLLLLSVPIMADYELNLRPGVTETSERVYDLHMLIMWICVAIGVVVYGVLAYSIFRHRKSRGAAPATFHESTKVEVAWTIIPILILVGIAIPATKALIAMEDPGDYDMTIKVTGYQWKWRYTYLDNDIDFFSNLAASSKDASELGSDIDPSSVPHYLLNVDNPLVIPTNKRIRFLITANDVIHSWWVPDLGWKKDAIPGFVNAAWTKVKEPGIYRGQCAELCGRGHGFMPVVVVAKTEKDFDQWVAEQKQASQAASAAALKTWTKEDLMAKGEQVYNSTCAACHQPTGQGLPGVFPALAGSAIATGPVDAHMAIVLNGKTGTAMQAFRDQMNDVDLAAVITYERNAFGNNTGDTVQPADIKAAR
jgi:cytochrome c oxidase subunit 2